MLFELVNNCLCSCVPVCLCISGSMFSVCLFVCVPVCLYACMPVCLCVSKNVHTCCLSWLTISVQEMKNRWSDCYDSRGNGWHSKTTTHVSFLHMLGLLGVYKWFQNTFAKGHRTLLCLLGYANCTLYKVVLVLFWRQQLHWNFPSQMIESRSHIMYRKESNTLVLGLSLKPETIVGAGGQVYDHVNTSSLTNGF